VTSRLARRLHFPHPERDAAMVAGTPADEVLGSTSEKPTVSPAGRL
jgi:hypothetical protein